jgi:hypothetical protein
MALQLYDNLSFDLLSVATKAYLVAFICIFATGLTSIVSSASTTTASARITAVRALRAPVTSLMTLGAPLQHLTFQENAYSLTL